MSVFWGRNGDLWEPQGGEHKEWRDLEPGDLIVLRRRVLRVVEARLVPVADWDEQDCQWYEHYGTHQAAGDKEAWRRRPVYLIVIPVGGSVREHKKIRPYRKPRAWALHPHYPVCAECGQPWPCPELDIKREADKAAAELARLEKVLPGCCWACGDPVTSRHKSVVFAGENLLLPGGGEVVFHLRRKATGGKGCLSAATFYEDKWVAAAPGRLRRLSCHGNLVVHVDGRECSEYGYCPGPDAWHRGNATWHRFTGTEDGQVVPVPGSGADKCRRCLDAVEAGFYADEQAAYLARKAAGERGT